mgnify:FL=1
MPSQLSNLLTSCLRFRDEADHEDALLTCDDIKSHAYGKFSMAIVQANQLLEDQGQVESGPFGTFIGVYDGHGGPEASEYIKKTMFPHLSSKNIHHLYESFWFVCISIVCVCMNA